MKKMWKYYNSFVPLWVRVIWFFVMPAVLVGMLALGTRLFTWFFALVTVEAVWLFAEAFFDFWAFGGMFSREKQLEYVKSSYMGRGYIEKIFLTDLVRRIVNLILMAVFFDVVGITIEHPDLSILMILNEKLTGQNAVVLMVASSLMFTAGTELIAVFLLRHFSNVFVAFLVAYIAAAINGLLQALAVTLPGFAAALSAVYLIAAGALLYRGGRKCVTYAYRDNK